MSIVNRETLARIKHGRQSAYDASTWESSYHRAMRALDAAIAQIEQIDSITANMRVRVEILD